MSLKQLQNDSSKFAGHYCTSSQSVVKHLLDQWR